MINYFLFQMDEKEKDLNFIYTKSLHIFNKFDFLKKMQEYVIEYNKLKQKVVSFQVEKSFENIFVLSLFEIYFNDIHDQFNYFYIDENIKTHFIINDHKLKFSPKNDFLIQLVIDSSQIISKLIPFIPRSIITDVGEAAIEIRDDNKSNIIFYDKNSQNTTPYTISKNIIINLANEIALLESDNPLIRFAITSDSIIYKEGMDIGKESKQRQVSISNRIRKMNCHDRKEEVEEEIVPILSFSGAPVFQEYSNFILLVDNSNNHASLSIFQNEVILEWKQHSADIEKHNFITSRSISLSSEIREKETEHNKDLFFCCMLCERTIESSCMISVFNDEKTNKTCGFCIDCLRQKLEFSISSFYNFYNNHINTSCFYEMPEIILPFNYQNREKCENGAMWPQSPLGNIAWAICNEKHTSRFIKLWLYGVVQFIIRHSQ